MTVRELRKIARFLVQEVKGVAVQAYDEHGHPVHASLTIGEDGSVSAHVSINEPRCQSTQGREELRTPSAGSSQRDHSRAQFGHQDAHPSSNKRGGPTRRSQAHAMGKMEKENASRNVGKSRAPEGSSSPSTQTPHSSRADEVQKERDNMIAIVQAAVSGHCTPVAAEELLESCEWDLKKTLACLSEGNDEQKVEHRGNAGPVIEHCMPNKGSLSSTSSSRQALTPTATPMVHSGAVKEPKGRPATACSRATTSSTSSPADTSSQPSAVHGDVSKGSPQNHPGQDRSVNRSKAAGTVIAHGGGASTFGPGGRGHGHGKRGRGPGSGRVTRSGAG